MMGPHPPQAVCQVDDRRVTDLAIGSPPRMTSGPQRTVMNRRS